MVKAFIISGICFTIGNLIWDKFDDPRVFYIPLSVFLFVGAWYVKKTAFKEGKITDYFLDYILLLAAGNIIKQVCYYNGTVAEVNDLYWGAALTLWLIARIIKLKWAIRNKRRGKNGVRG